MPETRRILVTGAGGFIGGRIVEILHELGLGEVRAAMRRWSSGARVGRFPVEIVKCDIRDAAEVRAALEGVTHVVHCAVGDRSTTVDGFRTLLAEVERAGVQRVVYTSTIDVYGSPTGTITEAHPLVLTGKPYGDSKIEAEQVGQEFAARGVPLTMLRPTLVHGPFSTWWTIAFAQRLQSRPWLVPEAASQGTCNIVYVDDLVGAVIAALEADTAPGSAYNINGPDRPTWSQYFHALNDAMGLPPLIAERPGRARLSAMAMQPVRKSAKLALKYFQPQIMAAYKRSDLVKSVMKKAEGAIRTTPTPEEFVVYSRVASYETGKAQRELGWQPRFPMADALPLAAEWLRQNGFITMGRDR